MRINFSYEATSTHTAYLTNLREVKKSLLRLSTGRRILEAMDDAAGLFIADQLSLVATGLEEGNRNIKTGISALRIAEHAAGQIFEKLQNIYARAVRAANDINDPNARQALQQEIANLRDAIQKIATDTEYNGIKLLDGTFQNKYIHYGPRANQVVSVSIGNLRALSLGAYIVSGTGRVTSGAGSIGDADGDFLLTGDYSDSLTVAGQEVLTYPFAGAVLVDAATAAKKINETLASMGIEAFARNRSVAETFSGAFTGSGTVELRFYIGEVNIAEHPLPPSNFFTVTGITENTTLDELVNAINTGAAAGRVNITAKAEGGRLVLETTNGETIGIEVVYAGPSGGSLTVNLAKILQGSSTTPVVVNEDTTAHAIRIGALYIVGTKPFEVNENYIDIVGPTGADSIVSPFQSLYDIDVTSNEGVEIAMIIVKKAMQYVDRVRSDIGAIMNNLQSIFDAQKVAFDNTREAESVIRNLDYAEEMANFTTLQIRMQSTIAMLAQANALPQLVLQLLR